MYDIFDFQARKAYFSSDFLFSEVKIFLMHFRFLFGENKRWNFTRARAIFMPVKMFKISVALTLVMNELFQQHKESARGLTPRGLLSHFGPGDDGKSF